MSTERVIVHKDIADTFIAAVREVVGSLKAGDTAVDTSCKLGPLSTEKQAQRFLGLVKQSQEAGAQILLGDLTANRAVVQPHIVRGVKPGMALWEEESFGPGTTIFFPASKCLFSTPLH